ncbi:hypothetical protein A2U01_0088509, partial [Trifolium medium]|nr:hypothetical protein [Trifolium medium]
MLSKKEAKGCKLVQLGIMKMKIQLLTAVETAVTLQHSQRTSAENMAVG